MFDLNTAFINHILAGIKELTQVLPIALFDLLVGALFIRLFIRALRLAMRATKMQQGLQSIAVSVVEIVLWMILATTLLKEVGLGGVIIFLTGSVAAIALVMAAGGSTLISDIIAGLFLAGDSDFNIGDEVIVGETPTLGTIESMDARRTRIRDSKGILHVLPNSLIERKEWVVMHKRAQTPAIARAASAAIRLGKAARVKRARREQKPDNISDNEQ
jgi:small conductance mechanosensitive channel